MHAYLLLDRTGSMQSRWVEALGAIDAYVKELSVDPKTDDLVTLAVFDSVESLKFEVLRRKVHPVEWQRVRDDEASPRGNTPLFDAIGRIVALAEADAPDRAVIVIITDGEENASREMKREDAKAALDRCEAKGWQIVFLGAEFAKFGDAEAVGVVASKRMAYSRGRAGASMQGLAQKTRLYRDIGADVNFDEADRKQAGEDDVDKT